MTKDLNDYHKDDCIFDLGQPCICGLTEAITRATDEAYQRGYNTGWVRRNRAEPFPQPAPAKMQVDKSKLKDRHD